MNQYSIRIDYNFSDKVDYTIIPLLKPSSNYQVVYARLLKMMEKFSGDVSLLCGSLPILSCRLQFGRMFNEVYRGEKRTDAEIARDLADEQRRKLKRGRQYGFVKGDLTSWIKKGPEEFPDRTGLKMIKTDDYSLQNRSESRSLNRGE